MSSASPSASPTIAPTAAPSLTPIDCRSTCTVYSATTVPVVQGFSAPGSYILPPFFKLTLQVRNVLLTSGLNVRTNILDITDAGTGASLLSIYATNTLALQVRYNGQILSDSAPQLTSPLSTYTTIHITASYSTLAVVIGGSSSVFNFGSRIDTTDRLYKIWLSNPTDTSAECEVYTLLFSGIFCAL